MLSDWRKTSASSHSAFTVVELIVVVGIISVLATLILPAAGKVSAVAKQLRCAANMRQISAALIAYAADHDGFYPVAPGIGEMGDPSIAYWMLPTNGGAGQIDYSHGQLWKYLDPNGASANDNALKSTARYRIFNCPADDEDLRLTAWQSISLWPRNYSYSFNMEMRQRPVGGSVGWTYGIRLVDVANPTQKILTVEEQWPNDGFAVLGWVDETAGNFRTRHPTVSRCYADVLSARHNGLGNQGFADGHVEAIDPRQLGFDIDNIEFGTTSGPTNTSDLVAARALDLFYR